MFLLLYNLTFKNIFPVENALFLHCNNKAVRLVIFASKMGSCFGSDARYLDCAEIAKVVFDFISTDSQLSCEF